jgi:Spy/CpxP family protein refolding chaperone
MYHGDKLPRYPINCAWCAVEGLKTITGYTTVPDSSGICPRHVKEAFGRPKARDLRIHQPDFGRRVLILALILAFSLALGWCAVNAQEPPRGDPHKRPPRNEDGRGETLTDAQKEQVKAILSRYDATRLTAEDSMAIHEAFRRSGLRGGPAMSDAIRASGFDPDRLRELAPPPGKRGSGDRPPSNVEGSRPSGTSGPSGQGGGQGSYSIEQAVSDRAQLHTIAFNGLAFLTGDFGADTFIPPGKVCDYFGFQYMRDIDAAEKGHNPMFLNRIAGNVLRIFRDEQRASFEKAARGEASLLQVLAEKRFPLIKAFYRELVGDIPAGCRGLDKSAVVRYTGEIFALDAELAWRRAQLFGQLAASLTAAQKADLAKMRFGDFNSWPDVDMERYKLPRGSDKLVNVAYMTYASEFFSWYAGSVEADTYFCPERHGTYFGGFYMKDMPAMGKRDYDISTSVTGDKGGEFLNLLTGEQRAHITALPELQRRALQEIVTVRRAVSTELRRFLKGEQASQEKVLSLGRRYGELDGELSYYNAVAFAKVKRTLTAEQQKALVKLRNLEGYTSAPAYIYSSPIQGSVRLPETDSFFAR